MVKSTDHVMRNAELIGGERLLPMRHLNIVDSDDSRLNISKLKRSQLSLCQSAELNTRSIGAWLAPREASTLPCGAAEEEGCNAFQKWYGSCRRHCTNAGHTAA